MVVFIELEHLTTKKIKGVFLFWR